MFCDMENPVPEQRDSNFAMGISNHEGEASPSQEERRAIEKILDVTYYLQQNPDVKAAQMDPVIHFCHYGWKEKRNPSPFFDVQYYLKANPDVAATGINPVFHYVLYGEKEGRRPSRPLDSLRKRLEAAVSPRKTISEWEAAACKGPALSADELEKILLPSTSEARLIISFSQDDYINNFGGVQNVVSLEQHAFNKRGWKYLHVAPAKPLPLLADETSADIFKVSLRINGEQLGLATFQELIQAASSVTKRDVPVECVVHHLLGFSPELVGEFLRKTGLDQPIFWIHDFFSVCPNYVLMRNNVAFCGCPDPDSGACRICCYGTERKEHLQRIQSMFRKINPKILAPSQAALKLWKASALLQYQTADVVPLARLVRAPHPKFGARNNPLRIGFTGALAYPKGWDVFEELAYRHVNDERYLFFHLGRLKETDMLPVNIRHRSVNVNRESRNDMVEAVAQMRIDVIVNWSLWPETFCFTALEGLAGGAFVVARASAGNVWPLIEANAPDQGCAVGNRTQLFDLFQNGEIQKLVNNANCRYGILIRGNGTADWLSRIHSEKSFPIPPMFYSNQLTGEQIRT
jgi:hypothetical protein